MAHRSQTHPGLIAPSTEAAASAVSGAGASACLLLSATPQGAPLIHSPLHPAPQTAPAPAPTQPASGQPLPNPGRQGAVRLAVLLLAASVAPAANLEFQVRHERLLRDRTGVLSFDETGVSWREAHPKKKPEKLAHGRWSYQDLQQVYLAPGRVVLLTYQDRTKWLAAVDREFEFYLLPKQDLQPAYNFLKNRLDERLTAAFDDQPGPLLAELPVKHTRLLEGSEGVLRIGEERLVYATKRKEQTRTWRWSDLATLERPDPRTLILTTHERAISHYGSRRDFRFQLKQPLSEPAFEKLWKRLHQDRGLAFLNSLRQP
jgi:hypothetical protein